jgi:hypothetical protein
MLLAHYTLFGVVGKVNQPAQIIISRRANTTTSYVYCGVQIWAGRQQHIGPPYCFYRCTHRPHPLLLAHYTLFGIVGKVNQPAQTIVSLTYDATTLLFADEIKFGLAASNTLGHHIVSIAVHIGLFRCYWPIILCLV